MTKGKSLILTRNNNIQISKYATLPKFPVPKLDDTIQKFVQLAKPIVSAEEFNQTMKTAEKFLASGEGDELQSLLEKRSKKMSNWLSSWWLDVAYLQARTPLPIVTTPAVLLPKFNYFGISGQVDFAAKLIFSAVLYMDNIEKGRIPPDRAGKDNLDMSQYRYLYGTTRVPKLGIDQLRYGMNEPIRAKHIAVARNGHFFSVPVFDTLGNRLKWSQITVHLKSVVQMSHQLNQNPVGILTSENRDCWARIYKRLKKNNTNAATLEALETALFLVCLDGPIKSGMEGSATEEQARQALHGGGMKSNSGNRWFDKTIQFTIGLDGYGGLCYEHSPADGPPVGNLMDFICSQFETDNFPDSDTADNENSVMKLDFILNEEDREAIRAAGRQFDIATKDIDINVCSFRHFGKNIPKSHRISPDSFIQLALQLTFYRLHGEHPPTYETGSLRKFADARTETIRLPNKESKEFVEVFDMENNDASKVVELLKKAAEAHKHYSMEAMQGRGIDRHLLGLKLAAIENGRNLPPLLMDVAYQKMQHFKLSTSQVPTKHILPMCFGPSAPDCYGICYNPFETELHFCITAFFSFPGTSAVRFAKQMERTLLDIESVLVRNNIKAKL